MTKRTRRGRGDHAAPVAALRRYTRRHTNASPTGTRRQRKAYARIVRIFARLGARVAR